MAQEKPSRMINTASLAGFVPFPLTSLYSASKFAIVGMTEAIHHELRLMNASVQISLLVPVSVKSRIFDDAGDRATHSPAARELTESALKQQEKHAMSPAECARHTFDGIARGDFWLLPQPEPLDALVQARMQAMRRRQPPALPSTPDLPGAEDYAAVLHSR